MLNNKNPVMVITGGSRGLGKAIVCKALENNYRVATCSRQKNSFITDLENQPFSEKNFYWESVDISNADQQHYFFNSIMERFGTVDVLVNNAGAGLGQLLNLSNISDILNTIHNNLTSAITMSRLCMKPMMRQKNGIILNISSVLGLNGYGNYSCYSAAKSGLHGFTKSLAKELGLYNIRVNAIAPGYFESDMVKEIEPVILNKIRRRTPLRRLATIDDIINAVFFLINPATSFISGQILAIDGGFSC